MTHTWHLLRTIRHPLAAINAGIYLGIHANNPTPLTLTTSLLAGALWLACLPPTRETTTP